MYSDHRDQLSGLAGPAADRWRETADLLDLFATLLFLDTVYSHGLPTFLENVCKIVAEVAV
jgi:hypothetical protein